MKRATKNTVGQLSTGYQTLVATNATTTLAFDPRRGSSIYVDISAVTTAQASDLRLSPTANGYVPQRGDTVTIAVGSGPSHTGISFGEYELTQGVGPLSYTFMHSASLGIDAWCAVGKDGTESIRDHISNESCFSVPLEPGSSSTTDSWVAWAGEDNNNGLVALIGFVSSGDYYVLRYESPSLSQAMQVNGGPWAGLFQDHNSLRYGSAVNAVHDLVLIEPPTSSTTIGAYRTATNLTWTTMTAPVAIGTMFGSAFNDAYGIFHAQQGLFTTADRGVTWTQRDSSNLGDRLVATANGYFYSTNGVGVWRWGISGGATQVMSLPYTPVSIDAYGSLIVVCGGDGEYPYFSRDSGTTWQEHGDNGADSAFIAPEGLVMERNASYGFSRRSLNGHPGASSYAHSPYYRSVPGIEVTGGRIVGHSRGRTRHWVSQGRTPPYPTVILDDLQFATFRYVGK